MMYPSNSYFQSSNSNNDNLMSPHYTLDQALLNRPSIYEFNPNSTLENPLPPLYYYNIPSPLYHYENDDFFGQHMYELHIQQQSQITEVNAPNAISSEMGEHSDNINEGVIITEIPKTKTSKKDRHSKIATRQGLRDRRMRLSLPVAREFFDLQDKLKYNKASKTVEWLMSKAKLAIENLNNSSTNSPSSTSECEVVSLEKGKRLSSPTKEANNQSRSTRKSTFNPLSKESREKARARARERTIEKQKADSLKKSFETTKSHQMDPIGSWCQNEGNGSQLEELENVGELSSSMIFNYNTHEDGISKEHQYVDFDLYGKPWYAYNNTNQR